MELLVKELPPSCGECRKFDGTICVLSYSWVHHKDQRLVTCPLTVLPNQIQALQALLDGKTIYINEEQKQQGKGFRYNKKMQECISIGTVGFGNFSVSLLMNHDKWIIEGVE